MENKVGGSYHASFTNFTTGNSHSFGGKYVDIKPNELLKYTVRFVNSGLKPGSAQLTLDKAEFAFTRNRLTGQSINLQYESEVDIAQIGSGKKIHQAEIPQTRGIG